MKNELLKEYALNLKVMLEKYSDDEEVGNFSRGILPYIERALTDKINKPLEFSEVPGEYFFRELSLSQYDDLEEAYSKFKLEVTGGDDEWADILAFMKTLG